jgi:hypothetical protein
MRRHYSMQISFIEDEQIVERMFKISKRGSPVTRTLRFSAKFCKPRRIVRNRFLRAAAYSRATCEDGKAPRAVGGASLASFEDGDVLLEEVVGEIGEGDALLGGEGREIGLDIGVEIDGQVESGAGPMELAAGSAGEVDLGRDVVVVGGGRGHRITYRGSSS